MEKKRPQLFFKNIIFNDGTKIELEHNAVVVFTGSNNSGKSQILKDAENISDKSYHLPTVVIKQAEHTYSGEINESVFLNDKFIINQNGSYQIFGANSSFSIETLIFYWKEHTLYNDMHTLFIKRLETELRLTASNALERNRNPEQHQTRR